jgi:hypothetical protein
VFLRPASRLAWMSTDGAQHHPVHLTCQPARERWRSDQDGTATDNADGSSGVATGDYPGSRSDRAWNGHASRLPETRPAAQRRHLGRPPGRYDSPSPVQPGVPAPVWGSAQPRCGACAMGLAPLQRCHEGRLGEEDCATTRDDLASPRVCGADSLEVPERGMYSATVTTKKEAGNDDAGHSPDTHRTPPRGEA